MRPIKKIINNSKDLKKKEETIQIDYILIHYK